MPKPKPSDYKVIRNVMLAYKGGSSDKVYQVTLAEVEGGYRVDGWNARRGDPLTQRPQNKTPVTLAKANELFDSLVSKKKNDRETPYKEEVPASGAYVPPPETSGATERVGVQLLTEISEGDVAAKFLLRSDYAAEQKYDGHRRLIQVEGKTITGYNKLGEPVALPSEILDEVKMFNGQGPLMLDGEQIGTSYFAFDLREVNGTNIEKQPFAARKSMLKLVLTSQPFKSLNLGRTEYTEQGKAALCKEMFDQNLEGIVLKNVNSPYLPGRRPDQYKHKFTTTHSFIVIKPNEKNSVTVGTFTPQGKLIENGSVTIRNKTFEGIKPGDVIEVRYLHAFPESNRIYQPRMVAIRSDVRPTECLLSLLRFKNAPDHLKD